MNTRNTELFDWPLLEQRRPGIRKLYDMLKRERGARSDDLVLSEAKQLWTSPTRIVTDGGRRKVESNPFYRGGNL